jgi:transposase-like protein
MLAELIESWAMGRPKSVEKLFVGRHFDREVIMLCVRWYLRFKLSLRDMVEMMNERGLSLAHTTIMRWVQRDVPAFEKRWRRFGSAVGPSLRVDETYVKIRGKWCYLYRAVGRAGRTVDFRLSPRRDVGAAKAFFCEAIKGQGHPEDDHPERLRCLSPCGARTEARWLAARGREGAFVEIPE